MELTSSPSEPHGLKCEKTSSSHSAMVATRIEYFPMAFAIFSLSLPSK